MRRLFLPLAVLVGIALAIPTSATASPHHRAQVGPGTKIPAGGHLATPFSTRVSTLADMTKFQSGFGGQTNSPDGGLAVLYVVRGHEAGLLAAVRGEAGAADAGYRVVYVPHSWAQIQSLTAKIASQVPQWRARGVELAKWGPNPAASKVVIWLRSYSPAAARQLQTAYGADWVSVSHTPMTERIAATGYSRTPVQEEESRAPTGSRCSATLIRRTTGQLRPATAGKIPG